MPFSIRPHRHLPLAYFSGFWSLIILLLLSSGPANAEWVALIENNEVGMTVYVDKDTIRRRGNVMKWWQLLDYKTIQTMADTSFLSVKLQLEFDCAEDLMRTLAMMQFSGNMGRGKVVYSNSDIDKWEPVAPDSRGQTLWKVACGKK